jgi:hypothetical protein
MIGRKQAATSARLITGAGADDAAARDRLP